MPADLSDEERDQFTAKNPHLVDLWFQILSNEFIEKWLKETMGAQWYWYRFEFTQSAGQIHVHGISKLKSDPGLQEHAQLCKLGYIWLKRRQLGRLTADEQTEADLAIAQMKISEAVITSYVDQLVCTVNPAFDDEGNPIDSSPGSTKHANPIRQSFADANPHGRFSDDDYSCLVNQVNRHTICREGRCLKDGVCRFGYPKALQSGTEVVYKEIRKRDGTIRIKVAVVTERNDPRMNSHERTFIQGYRANVDLQVILDEEDCLAYTTKYVTKAEIRTKAMQEFLMKFCEDSSTGQNSIPRLLKQVMIRALGTTDVTQQETLLLLLGLDNFRTNLSFDVVRLDSYRKINARRRGGRVNTECSIVDYYAKRLDMQDVHRDLSLRNMSLMQFAKAFQLAPGGKLKRRNGAENLVIKTYPLVTSNPGSTNYKKYCKKMLLLHQPWVQPENAFWLFNEKADDNAIEEWHAFLDTPAGILNFGEFARTMDDPELIDAAHKLNQAHADAKRLEPSKGIL